MTEETTGTGGRFRGRAVVAVLAVVFGCTQGEVASQDEDPFKMPRERMVREHLGAALQGRKPVRDEAVLKAMATVPRHRFVPERLADVAYADRPLPIGSGQTISQPYIVATMTEALLLESGDKVLEIGTGSGYQAAVLAELVEEVYTIEIVPELGRNAAKLLAELGYKNVVTLIGDGYGGWPEHAPFDAVIVTAAPDHVPQPLVDQLKTGGRMVIPVGPELGAQRLLRLTKQADGTVKREFLEDVRFVPLTGESRERGKK